jgi:hypothetical protein
VLEAEKLPAGITNLRTGLANVDRDNFTHLDLMRIACQTQPIRRSGSTK